MKDIRLLRRDAQRFGWPKVLYRGAMRRCEKFLQLYRITSRSLGLDDCFEPSPAEARIASEQELRVAGKEIPDQLTTGFIDAAIARGDVCLAAFLDGRIVAFTWRSYSTAPHTNRIWVKFKTPYRYGYKSFTLPEFRGRHLLDARHSDLYCRGRGAERSIGFVASHNLESLKRSSRIGNEFIGFAGYLQFFGRVWFFRSPSVKRAGFEFYLKD